MAGKLPDYVVACVGGGSNAIGMFHPFVGDVDAGDVKLVGVEAGGKGMDALNSATLTQGSPGVLHGTRTYLLQVRARSCLGSVLRFLPICSEVPKPSRKQGSLASIENDNLIPHKYVHGGRSCAGRT